MVCLRGFVLQEVAGLYCSLGGNCIAGVALYCNRECSRLDRVVL